MGCEEVIRDGEHLLSVAMVGESFNVFVKEGERAREQRRRAWEADESCKKGWQHHRAQIVALMLSAEMGYVG